MRQLLWSYPHAPRSLYALLIVVVVVNPCPSKLCPLIVFVVVLREWKGRRLGEGEGKILVGDNTSIDCLPHMPLLGPGIQPTM